MENTLRDDIAGALAEAERKRARKASSHRVVSGDRVHRIIEISPRGFTIETDQRPPLRGYVEIFHGHHRVDRPLVVCDWAAEGQAGYLFKHDSVEGYVPADYVRPDIAGLIEGPDA